MARRGEKQYGGQFICPSCGLPRKRKKYPKTSTCRWCVGAKRRVSSIGYIDLWKPGHPLARKDGYVSEHRKVLHDAGVEIPPGAHVHHVNGDKQDNRKENLWVLTPRDHKREHVPIGAMVRNQHGEFPRWRP
jgi:HNH endonuclease